MKKFDVIDLYRQVMSDHNQGVHVVDPLLAYVVDKYDVTKILDDEGNEVKDISDLVELNAYIVCNILDESTNVPVYINGKKHMLFSFLEEYEPPKYKWLKSFKSTNFIDEIEDKFSVDHYELEGGLKIDKENASERIGGTAFTCGFMGVDLPEFYLRGGFGYEVVDLDKEIIFDDVNAFVVTGEEKVRFYKDHSDAEWIRSRIEDVFVHESTDVFVVLKDGRKKEILFHTEVGEGFPEDADLMAEYRPLYNKK